MVKEFEQLLPGAAERLFRMAEKEQDHRHENDHRGYGYFSRGQWMALTIAILVLCVAAYMVSQGQGLIGLGTILIGLGPIIYTLMTGLKNGASENKE